MTTIPFFFNQCLDKGRLKRMILWSLTYQGESKTIQIIETLKTLGFRYATHAGVSLGIDDLSIPPKKGDEVRAADLFVTQSTQGGYLGNRTAIEELQSVIDTWHRASENVKDHVIDYFEAANILNPVYMMAFSGARGNVSQVRQLVGMRGLMADPKGDIIGFPIRSNFREGLTVTEYMISCYGARKGVVDTALRTADAGYLTRRLVDVSQHMVVKQGSCGTRRGITVGPLKSFGKTVLKLSDRLVGRVLAADFVHQDRLIARRNEPISEVLADRLAKLSQSTTTTPPSRLLVRSPLTCELRSGVCQLCYGWSLTQNAMVTIGEAVGIIAGQSIGEPGTQLTMRTFHTGGVFTGDVSEEFRTPHGGRVTFPTPFPGKIVRTSYGQIAFLVKKPGCMVIIDEARQRHTRLTVPMNTALFVREGQSVSANQLIGQFDGVGGQQNERVRTKKIVFSSMSGQVVYENTQLAEARLLKQHATLTRRNYLAAGNIGTAWILAGERLGSTVELLPMYQSSGHVVGAKTTLKRSVLTAQHDWFVRARHKPASASVVATPHMFPPGATYRVRPLPSERLVSTWNTLYAPLISGHWQHLHSGIDLAYTRIQTPTGDCIDFPNTVFQKTAWSFHAQAPTRTPFPGDVPGSPFAPTLACIYLPAACKTHIGGAFWYVRDMVDARQRHGFLFFISRVSVGVFAKGLWSACRLSWRASRRIQAVSTLTSKPRRLRFARWVVAGHVLTPSMTLQGQPASILSQTYGLLQASRPVDVLQARELPPSPMPGKPHLVQNCLRPDASSYDLTAAVTAFDSLASLYQFPFSTAPLPPATPRQVRVYPSWLYFPKSAMFDMSAVTSPAGFELAWSFQTFVPALINAQHAFNVTQARTRTHSLFEHVVRGAVGTSIGIVPTVRVPMLPAIRQVFALRHPELLHCMRTGAHSAFPAQSYRAAQRLQVFTHVLSPWVSCVQPSTYSLPARATLARPARFMGWMYASTRLGAGFVPSAYHQVRKLRQVNFDALMAETLVLAHAAIAPVSVDRLQTVARRLSVAQSFEGARLRDQLPQHRPAVWVKQQITSNVPIPDLRPQTRVALPFLRRWLRTPTYALRVVSKMRVPAGFSPLQLTFTNPAGQTPLHERAWSVGVCTHPTKADTLLGATNTLYLAAEPVSTRARPVKDEGELFVTSKRDVIMLRARHVIALSLENLTQTQCTGSVGDVLRYGDELVPGFAMPVSGQIITITPSQIVIRRAQPVLFYKGAALHVQNCEWVQTGHPMVTLSYQRLITGDIVQGIPKVEQVFEASRRRDASFNAHRFVKYHLRRLKGQENTPQKARRVLALVQRRIIDRIQQIYLDQGVTISDKHFEVVVRQMTSFVQIRDPGKSGLLRNEILPIARVERINLGIKKQKAEYSPVVLGISKVALSSGSFLSSASFQETTRVLTRDALLTRTDFLRGLKERVILGDLIPAGTGVFATIRFRQTAYAEHTPNPRKPSGELPTAGPSCPLY